MSAKLLSNFSVILLLSLYPSAECRAASNDDLSGRKDVKPSNVSEIVVTASKRETNIEKLPQAVSALSGGQLDDLNAQTFEDYFRFVPGLMVQRMGTGKFDFSLRGVSSAQIDTNPGTFSLSTVAEYIDEIPVSGTGFQLDPRIVDVDRIEVLRGPQGTHYGEGALGGALRVITKKPDLNAYGATADARVSQTDGGGTNSAESLTLNLPVVGGKVGVRLSGFYATDAGYIDRINVDAKDLPTKVDRTDINDSRSSGYRGQLLVKPTDRISILAEAIHTRTRDDGIQGYQPGVGDLRLRVCPPSQAQTSTTVGPPPPGGGAGGVTGVTGGAAASDMCVEVPDEGRISVNSLYNLTSDLDLGWGKLVSSSSWADNDTSLNVRTLGSTLSLGDASSPGAGGYVAGVVFSQQSASFTEELRLSRTKAKTDRWDYLLGVTYQDRTIDRDFPALKGVINGEHHVALTIRQYAAFGEVGYDLSDRLNVRIGLRAEDVSNRGLITADPPVSASAAAIRSGSRYTPVTGRGVLNYTLNDHALVYGSISRGFRNGGLNDTTLNYANATMPRAGFVPVPAAYGPDTVRNYELGWKLVIPERRAFLNGAVYHIDWLDMQVQAYVPGTPLGVAPTYVNAPRAGINGLELEGGLELLQGLQVQGSLSLIDARLTKDFPLYLAGGGVSLHGKDGDRIPFVARRSGSLSLSYRRPAFHDRFKVFAIVNEQYEGPRATDFSPSLAKDLPTYFSLRSYWLTGLQAGVENAQWRAAIFADNLTDARPDILKYSLDRKVTDRPRTFGVSLRRTFD